MRDLVKRAVDARMIGYLKSFPNTQEAWTITECCGSSTLLHVLPKGICVAVTAKPIDKLERLQPELDVAKWGYRVSEDSFDFGDGRYLSMRFTHLEDISLAGHPGEGPVRFDWIGGISHDVGPLPETTGIKCLYVVGMASYLYTNKKQVYTGDWNNGPWVDLTDIEYAEVKQYLLDQFKGNFIITITKSHIDYANAYKHITDLLESNKVYSSPMFNNRGYNHETDYLQLQIYKF